MTIRGGEAGRELNCVDGVEALKGFKVGQAGEG